VTGLVFLQLVLGATMRHEHAGLAIPDFPTAYGKWWPDTSESALASINAERVADDKVPTSATQIMVQMAHRIGAVSLLAAAIGLFLTTLRLPVHRSTVVWSGVLVGMVLLQATLGAWTIWSNKAADVATTHMALGALTLLYSVVFSFRICRGLQTIRFASPEPAMSRDLAARCA
jgi:cytochrome c oxidase assembly protein subunit 15